MEYIQVLLPSICVGLIFWYVIRTVMRADSIERTELDKYAAESDSPDTDITGVTAPEEKETVDHESSERKRDNGGQDGTDPH